jgi:hypothetical protein
MKRLYEVVILGALLLLVTSPITKPLWAQLALQGTATTLQTTGGNFIQSVANTTYSFSQVTTGSASAVQALEANTARRGMIIQNQSLNNIYVGTTSPVSSTSGITLGPTTTSNLPSRWQVDTNAPSGPIFVLGTSTVAQTVSVGEGR